MHTYTIQIKRREASPYNIKDTVCDLLGGLAFCSALGALVFFGLAL